MGEGIINVYIIELICYIHLPELLVELSKNASLNEEIFLVRFYLYKFSMEKLSMQGTSIQKLMKAYIDVIRKETEKIRYF